MIIKIKILLLIIFNQKKNKLLHVVFWLQTRVKYVCSGTIILNKTLPPSAFLTPTPTILINQRLIR